MTGWGDVMVTTNNAGELVDVDDATSAILIVIFLFILPAQFPDFLKRKRLVHEKNNLPA